MGATDQPEELIDLVSSVIDSPGLYVKPDPGETDERHAARAILHELGLLEAEEA